MTSLKDEAALERLHPFLDRQRFDIVLNATAFSARLDAEERTALDSLDAPVLQVVLARVDLEAWRASQRGLGPSDLAMHVALPEIDGRILSRAISFKAAGAAELQNGIRHGRASAARRSCRVRRRACCPLGESPRAQRRRTNDSLAFFRIILREADAPATRLVSIRPQAQS